MFIAILQPLCVWGGVGWVFNQNHFLNVLDKLSLKIVPKEETFGKSGFPFSPTFLVCLFEC